MLKARAIPEPDRAAPPASSASHQRLKWRPEPSRILTAYWGITHAGALGISLLVLDDWRAKLAICMLISAHAAWTFWTGIARRAPWSIRALTWDGRDWEPRLASGEWILARLLPSSFVGQRLIVLNFAAGGIWPKSLPLATDSLDPDQLRRLRAELRRSPGVDDARQDETPSG